MLLETMKATKAPRRLSSGMYTGSLKDYKPAATSLTLTFTIEDVDYVNTYDDVATDGSGNTWHPSIAAVTMLTGYLDNSKGMSIFDVLESLKNNATPLTLEVSGLYVKLKPHDDSKVSVRQPTQPIVTVTRKSRA